MNKALAFLRIALGCVFLYASKDKLFHPVEFADMVMGYRILPSELITLVATVLPWLEFLLGLGLVVGFLSVASAAWASLLSLGFLVAKASVVMRGLDVSCGCFSVSGTSSITWSDLPANAALLAVAILVLARGPGSWALDGVLIEEPQAANKED